MKLLPRAVGSLVLLGILAWRADYSGVLERLAGLNLRWWLAALAAYLAAQGLSAVRWRLLAGLLGFERRLGSFMAMVLVGNFFNLLLPTSVGGDVVRGWYLGGEGRRWPALLSVLSDRLNGVLVLVALACLAALVVPLPGWMVGSVAVFGTGAAVGLGLLLLSTTRTGQPWDRLRKFADALALGADDRRVLTLVTLLSLVVQLLNVLLVWAVGRALGLDVPLSWCFVLMPLVTLLTLVPISVNGMGVREAGTVVLLAPLGIPSGPAVLLSLAWFAVFLAAGLLGAAVYLLGNFSRCEVNREDEPVRCDPGQGRTRQRAAAA